MKIRMTAAAMIMLFLGYTWFLIPFSETFGRYAFDTEQKNSVKAVDFYLQSDVLSEQYPEYILSPGIRHMKVELRNHEDGLRYTEEDITYDLIVETIEGETVFSESGVLSKGKSGDEVLDLTLPKTGTYRVKMISETPYVKEIGAVVTVPDREDGPAVHLSSVSPEEICVVVSSYEKAGTVRLHYPQGLLPDRTDENPNAIVLSAYESCEIRFFKDADQAVSAADFYVVMEE